MSTRLSQRTAGIGVPTDFLTLDALTPEGLDALLDLAARMKADRQLGRNALAGGRIGLIFHKPSTRTRVSFEAAAWGLGMLPISMRADELQMGRGETVADTARTLSRYLDAIVDPDVRPRLGRGARRRTPASPSSTP